MASTEQYDLLLKGGHVIDPQNDIDAPMDVAISDGKIAMVAKSIPPSSSKKTVDVTGCYVTPGLIDLHVHVYGYKGSMLPDGYALPNGATTVVDAGGAGWRNFEDFKNKVIFPTHGLPTKTRVLAFLNIVGAGMLDFVEQNVQDMDPQPAAEMVMRYPDIIVGIKTAHFLGPGWEAVDSAVKAGEPSNTPAMFDVRPLPTRSYEDLLLRHLRPGDILTHMYTPKHPLLDEQGRVNECALEARERGVLFDVGHGVGSFVFKHAVPAIEQGFLPDTISTDLHRSSRLIPNATLMITMSKLLNMGLSLKDVVYRTTVTPAQAINRPELGNLSVGACADVAVLQVLEGDFGFVDINRTRLRGNRKLECVLTIRAGEIVWDLNGISWPDWQASGQ
jgi:dihydroorotase